MAAIDTEKLQRTATALEKGIKRAHQFTEVTTLLTETIDGLKAVVEQHENCPGDTDCAIKADVHDLYDATIEKLKLIDLSS